VRPEHVPLNVAEEAVAAFPGGKVMKICVCRCYPGSFAIVNERKIPFKRFKPGIKITSQTKFNICTKDLPIGALAVFLDKFLPNKILVPAKIATSTVTTRLKKKTFKQLIDRTGLAVKR
jgi:hypothetical protein